MENAACHFVYYSGPRKGDAETFRTARITIGKAGGNDFQLDPSADLAGAHHAEILLEEGGVYCLYDLGVKAGTYVNGERVHERCVIMGEDYIRFGQDGPEIIFRPGEAAPGKQKLPLVFPVTAELEFFTGTDAGRIFPIDAAIMTNIGRRTELQIPLDPQGDMIVSGNHCNIRYLDGHFVLTDTSRNGTYVNGDLVEQPMEIIDGDVIMLGDGGPQARFRVDLAKRHYPNHRILSPVTRPAAPAVSAFSKAEEIKPTPEPQQEQEPQPEPDSPPAVPIAAIPGSDKPLASAAPFVTGKPLPEPAPAETHADADLDEIGAADDASATEPDTAENDVPEKSTWQSDPAGPTPASGFSFKDSPLYPLLRNKKVLAAAGGVLALIIIIALISGGDTEPDKPAARGDYAAALKTLTPVEVPGSYNVQLPKSWPSHVDNQANKVSAESTDKNIAVDYVRDDRLNEAKVRQMLATNNAKVKTEAREVTSNDSKVKIMEATIGSVHRFAALHQPATGSAALAMLETNEATLKNLDETTLDKLLVDNLKLASEGTAVAQATPQSALPTPAATPAPEESPASTTTPTPAATPTAVADASTSVPHVEEQTVESKALKIKVTVPKSWNATSNEADAMITLLDTKGLEVRIARDENNLDPRGTFNAMKEEGWSSDGEQTADARFQAAEFSKQSENLLLILIPEKTKTTLVIYATCKQEFNGDQRINISSIVQQVLPAE